MLICQGTISSCRAPTNTKGMMWEGEGNKQKLKLRICEQLMIERSCLAGTMVHGVPTKRMLQWGYSGVPARQGRSGVTLYIKHK